MGKVYCLVICANINGDKKFNVTQNLKTDKYIKAVKRHENKIEVEQQLLTSYEKRNLFNVDLRKVLVTKNKYAFA